MATRSDSMAEAAPGLEDMMRAAIRAALVDTHTALPGRIDAYDPATQRATVSIELLRELETEDGERVELSIAPISNVPVMFPRSGGFALTFPVSVGDKCLIVFAERDISGWMQRGEVTVPPDARRHAYSDAIALLGLEVDTDALVPSTSATNVELRSDDGTTKLSLGTTGAQLEHAGTIVSISATGGITATRGGVELLTVLSTALDLIGTSLVAGSPLSNAAAIAAQKALVDGLKA